MRKAAVVATALLLGCFGLSAPAHSLSIGDLLSKVEGDSGFKTIHVTDLTAMRSKPGAKVVVYDANPPDVREEEGIIPGAHLLSSSGHYDVASTLPPDKNTPLVFYCHNTY
jgi:rhodanese-related sulfurtransferase